MTTTKTETAEESFNYIKELITKNSDLLLTIILSHFTFLCEIEILSPNNIICCGGCPETDKNARQKR